MNSRRAFSALALAVCSCLFLPACQERLAPPTPPPPTTHTIKFRVDSTTKKCEEQIDGGPFTDFVPVPWGDTVTFTAASSYTLAFVPPTAVSCASPFQGSGTCRSSFTSASATNGKSGKVTYSYDSLSVDGTTCDLKPGGTTGPMGMRMRP